MSSGLAEEILGQEKPGAFLLRYSERQGFYCLSYKYVFKRHLI